MFTTIRLQRFRSYRDESFELGPAVNIIVGPNASGKTNLLEALLVVCRGSSFRAKDSELVAFGADWARLDANTIDSGERAVKLINQDNGTVKKEFEIKGQKLARLLLSKTIPVVLFEPNHLLLLQGSPENRRDYLDNLLEQTVAGYGKLRRDYRRALAQRNALLKRGKSAAGQLFAWDIRLSQLGQELFSARSQLVDSINQQLDRVYKEIVPAQAAKLSLHYLASCDSANYASSMLKMLETRHDTDLERGFTTIGPHREDLNVLFDNRPVVEMASRGEIRTILLSLKVLELKLLEEARGEKPILLLDDVFSELDGARRQTLTEVISGYQTFITTTDADVVVQHFMDHCTIIPLTSS